MTKYSLFRVNFVEILLIAGLLASTPWIKNAIGCGGGNYYSPEPGINVQFLFAVAESLSGRGIVDNKVAVFTPVRIYFQKGHWVLQGSTFSYWADRDTHHIGGEEYSIGDEVEYRTTANGVVSGWNADQSGSGNLVIASIYGVFGTPNATLNSSIEVRDTGVLTPGTTDDPSNGTASAPTITWVVPEEERSDYLLHRTVNLPNPQNHHGHEDVYYITVYHSSGVKFTGLEVVEHNTGVSVSNCYNAWSCQESSVTTIDADNRHPDTLGYDMYSAEFSENFDCRISCTQNVFIREPLNPNSELQYTTNMLRFKFVGEDSLYYLRTRHESAVPDQCEWATGTW